VVDQITPVPEAGALSIVLRGDLAALLSVCFGRAKAQRPYGCWAFSWYGVDRK
jgi:hypothetical protein